MSYIEFVHSDKSLYKNVRKETFLNQVTLREIKASISSNVFSGTAMVWHSDLATNKKDILIYKISCTAGNFNGELIRYEDFAPKSLYGSATGMISGWRQPTITAHYRAGVLDGSVLVYDQTNTKRFALIYNMGLLDGEQKHYVEYSKFTHKYNKGGHVNTSKIAKSWLWSDKANELDSHLELIATHKKVSNGQF